MRATRIPFGFEELECKERLQLNRDFTKRPGEFFHIRKIEFRIINFPLKMMGKFLNTTKK